MNGIKVSVIVPTYNRLFELQSFVKSLEQAVGDHDVEILIVDDGSSDGTKEYFKKYKSQLDIKLLHQENTGPGAARNLGMTHSKGDYFLFIDSDCTVPQDYFTRIKKALSDHQYDAFGGPDTYREDFSPLLKAINYSMTSFIGTGGTRGSKKSVTKFYPRSFNMGISRKVYETIGEMGGLRHGQDMDYSARIYKAGFKVGLIEKAYVYHKRRTSLWKFFKQIFNWGVARINLSRLHPELLKPIHLAPAMLIVTLLSIFGLSIAFGWMREFLLLSAVAFGLLASIVMIQSLSWYKSISTSLLSIVTITIQILAYGLGLLYALIQIAIGKREAKGFVKHYYK
ncbi:MAG: glycosyltransferase [Rhodothermaceae bacterium TMED105]|nr:MAG: glycosyltransferase [Rhodothermaceae bacterium TMED105]